LIGINTSYPLMPLNGAITFGVVGRAPAGHASLFHFSETFVFAVEPLLAQRIIKSKVVSHPIPPGPDTI